MILLLGGSGYIGSAFRQEMHRRKLAFDAPPRRWVDYTRFDVLHNYLKSMKPDFVINTAGYIGRPNVDACEKQKAATVTGNTFFPTKVAIACDDLEIPLGHVSSGCIYNGPGPYKETDIPNFSWDSPPCSWYSGSKAAAEDFLKLSQHTFIWRLRLPFDEYDSERNYLSKLQRYPRLLQAQNSISHRSDFVKACLDLWQIAAPFGIYNMTNPGYVTTRQVVLMMHNILRLDRDWEFFEDDAEFYRTAAVAPRSNCVLDTQKLSDAGVGMRPVEEALKESLEKWQKE